MRMKPLAPKGSGKGGSRYGGAWLRVKVEIGSNSVHSSQTPRSSPLSYVSRQRLGAGDIKLKGPASEIPCREKSCARHGALKSHILFKAYSLGPSSSLLPESVGNVSHSVVSNS